MQDSLVQFLTQRKELKTPLLKVCYFPFILSDIGKLEKGDRFEIPHLHTFTTFKPI